MRPIINPIKVYGICDLNDRQEKQPADKYYKLEITLSQTGFNIQISG